MADEACFWRSSSTPLTTPAGSSSPNDGSHYKSDRDGRRHGDRDHAHHHVRQGATRGGMMVRGRRVLLRRLQYRAVAILFRTDGFAR